MVRKSDSRQASLLDLLQRMQELQSEPTTEGSLNIERELRISLAEGLKFSGMSAHQVAGEMSHLLGETITAEMIYSWTSESKNLHQIWGCRLPAFVMATKYRKPIEIITQAAGMFSLPGPEALRSEIQKLREKESNARQARRKREVLLKEMEG